MKAPIKTLGFSVVLIFSLLTISTSASAIKFSKVVFFGDSLSDMGNNQSGFSDQAPDTNKVPDGNGGYISGEVWAVAFVRNLQNDGLLESTSTGDIKPSIYYDENIEIKPNDSVDYAYSGDPSNGYPLGGHGGHVIQYHKVMQGNDGCVDAINESGTNALCGVRNRVRNFTNTKTVDPNALYVIWAGSNDIEQNLGAGLAKEVADGDIIDPNASNSVAELTVLQATNSIIASILELSKHHAKYFMVINLPNIGYTPQGYYLNNLYAQIHANDPSQKNVINELFTVLTNGFNDQLKKTLDATHFPNPVVIYQPDINGLFKMARNGEIKPFASGMFNKDPVYAWTTICCTNKVDAAGDVPPDYNPKECVPQDGAAMLCLPSSPQTGNYLFYNAIHPTTCVHKYLAKYFESYLPGGKAFNPNENLCLAG
jgi:phospholipase/lecithinase/hemolysin